MAESFDVFVSYASEDYEQALAQSQRMAALRVAFDPIQNRPPSTVLGVAKANILSLYRRFREPERDGPRKTDDEIRGELRSMLDRSRSVLVVWSYSHRGSMWANEEVSYFEQRYPERQLFCVKVEQLDAPRRWPLLEDSSDLTRERLEGGSARREPATPYEPVPGVPSTVEVLSDPHRWVRRAMDLRAGTTLSELLRLRVRRADNREAAAVVRAGRNALFSAVGVTGFLMATAAFELLALRPTAPVFARNAVLAVTSLWVCLLFASIQTSVAAVVPATLVGSVVGIAVESVMLVANDRRGAGAGAAAQGAFMSVLAVYQWRLSTTQRGRAMGWPEWSWVLRATALAVASIGLLGGSLSIIVARVHSKVQGPTVGVVAALLALVPFTATWMEVSRWGRLKEFFTHGARPALVVAAWFLAIAAGIWGSHPEVDHAQLRSGFIAGPVTGLCLSIMYLTPGMILGSRIPAHVRALAAVGGVSGSLALLALLLPVIDRNQLNGELGQTITFYLLSLLGVGVPTHLLLSKLRRTTHD